MRNLWRIDKRTKLKQISGQKCTDTAHLQRDSCQELIIQVRRAQALFGLLGAWVTTVVGPDMLRWILGVSFIAMALWMLIPDRLDEGAAAKAPRIGVFATTTVAFFLAEMGDKTQIATVALAAHYGAPLLVVIGTTLGMLIADVPAVFVGNKFAEKIPMKLVHSIAAAIFAIMGVLTLLKAEKLFQ